MANATRKMHRAASKRAAALRTASRRERRRMLITAIGYAGETFIDETPLDDVLLIARREIALALGADLHELEPGQLFVAALPREYVLDAIGHAVVDESERPDFFASLAPRAGIVHAVVLHEGATVAALYRLGGEVGFRFTSPGGDA